jgi:hypothetical protein
MAGGDGDELAAGVLVGDGGAAAGRVGRSGLRALGLTSAGCGGRDCPDADGGAAAGLGGAAAPGGMGAAADGGCSAKSDGFGARRIGAPAGLGGGRTSPAASGDPMVECERGLSSTSRVDRPLAKIALCT